MFFGDSHCYSGFFGVLAQLGIGGGNRCAREYSAALVSVPNRNMVTRRKIQKTLDERPLNAEFNVSAQISDKI